MSREGSILVLATLDTKAEEAAFVARSIVGRGRSAELVDLSLGPGGADGLGGPEARDADQRPEPAITREQIAEAAGTTPAAIAALPRATAMQVVAEAAAERVVDRVSAGSVAGVIAIGGGTGTWLAGEILGALPHGFPKLIVSTLTGRDAGHDVAVLTSVVDIAGLNRLLRPVLANAAGAICGMADGIDVEEVESRPAIALTMFGVTTEGATHLRQFLDEAGCEVIVFHANGAGGETMERLVREGAFDLVVDWTTSEVTDELTGGICAAGPHRLEAAAEAGVPQVVVPGAIDVINVHAPIPERFAGRTHHWHLPTVPLIRTSAEESAAIGSWMGTKLAAAGGPVHVLVPELGFSALDRPGGEFEDQAADRAWAQALSAAAGPRVPVTRVPHHINDEAFARATADLALELIGVRATAEQVA
jgi:uncharacterized protein (UPF0261 family)